MNPFHDKKIPPIVDSDADNVPETEDTIPCLVSRRQFLLSGGLATAVVMVGIPGLAEAQTPAVVATYERKFIAKLSELVADVPVTLNYLLPVPDRGRAGCLQRKYADRSIMRSPTSWQVAAITLPLRRVGT